METTECSFIEEMNVIFIDENTSNAEKTYHNLVVDIAHCFSGLDISEIAINMSLKSTRTRFAIACMFR